MGIGEVDTARLVDHEIVRCIESFPFVLGSESGHLYMTVIDADQNSNVHDNKFGNGNAIRVVGVHGWLVQSINNNSAWSRTLAQGMLPQDLDGDDVPTLDGL